MSVEIGILCGVEVCSCGQETDSGVNGQQVMLVCLGVGVTAAGSIFIIYDTKGK